MWLRRNDFAVGANAAGQLLSACVGFKIQLRMQKFTEFSILSQRIRTATGKPEGMHYLSLHRLRERIKGGSAQGIGKRQGLFAATFCRS